MQLTHSILFNFFEGFLLFLGTRDKQQTFGRDGSLFRGNNE